MKVKHEKVSAETGGSQHHLYGPYRLMTQSQKCNAQLERKDNKLFGMDRKPTRTKPDPCARLILL